MPIIYLEGEQGPDATNPGVGTGKTTLLHRFLKGHEGRSVPSTMIVGKTASGVRQQYQGFGDRTTVLYSDIDSLLQVFELHNNGRTEEDDKSFLQCQAGRYSNYIFDMSELPFGVDRSVFQRMVRLLAKGSYVYMTFKPSLVS